MKLNARRPALRQLEGPARADRRTKWLVKRLQQGDIAVLHHVDLDEVAADALIKARVRAVINTAPSVSGRYPNLGPLKLVRAGVPLLDASVSDPSGMLTRLADGGRVLVQEDQLFCADELLGTVTWLDEEAVLALMARSMKNLRGELELFVENTLTYANQEKSFFLSELPGVALKTAMQNRHVLVVVRGPTYRDDLRAIASYIQDVRPVLVGVDGGADALLEAGFQPALIVGDMDSVSDEALACGAELIVHAYPDGRAPGLARVEELRLKAHLYPAPGTSEDVAMLLAHEHGAELIVAVGTHSNMIDFLEKGRRGMASTVLTRMRIGNKLVDAKGVSLLYGRSVDWRAALVVAGAALVPMAVLLWLNTSTRAFFHQVLLNVKLLWS
ncbi:putative cytokinetic ring protein SteA [Tumebacillus flagellatus]|uniref:SteA-like C-terminal domain-containing protein n=1 Tax=Tumebacillus flagellatus TaxID=1157490 RepID=A0A074LR83_9BACL|nr:putative cytokinetic ring protein SteA [Tumebacillus flagellatus]KEO82348.1 hypothetical protein EL26_15600 [Tumebacillus flagellatus]